MHYYLVERITGIGNSKDQLVKLDKQNLHLHSRQINVVFENHMNLEHLENSQAGMTNHEDDHYMYKNVSLKPTDESGCKETISLIR